MPRDHRHHDLLQSDREAAELIAFLTNPASYATPVDRIEIIETHAARVILAGHQALKIKKRIRLPFLDFSTLSQRREALERELELNWEHAPEIYLGLAAISRRPDGTLAFGDENPIEVALLMNRFDQTQLLAHIAGRGHLSSDIARELAGMAARYHHVLPPVAGLSGAQIMRDTVNALAASLIADAPPEAEVHAKEFAARSADELKRTGALLDARAEAGLVRRCHGDLHLGNIVLLEGRAVPFDALEFDERLATIDVLYDLAFLLMDLDVRGDRAAANAVLNAYVGLRPTGSEIDGLAALPLFLATRAAVRALVSCESALQKPAGEDAEDTARAVSYLTAANAYLASHKPLLIAIGGLSGTGKSLLAMTLAPLVGPVPGALILRTDVERKQMFDVSETERLSPEHYTEEISDKVYDRLYQKAVCALKAGHGVVFDGVSSKPVERENLETIALDNGAGFTGLWLEAPLETQIARVNARHGDASDADAAVVHAQSKQELGAMKWATIDAGRSPSETLSAAITVLQQTIGKDL